MKLLKLKDKEKNLENDQPIMTHYVKRAIKSNDRGFLFRNHGVQKEVA